MLRRTILAALLLLSAGAHAQTTASDRNGWSGTGELGLAVSRGNSTTENLNARLDLANEDDAWKHKFHLGGVRARGEVIGDFDGDGVEEEKLEITANRLELGGSSALKLDDRNYWITALRYENDDFAPYANQATLAIGYGHYFIKNERTELSTEIGPGYRHAEVAGTGATENDFIGRGQLDFTHQLTDTTRLYDSLLVEAGRDNTFVQNDIGVAVAMNAALALKVGVQARHNTQVPTGRTEKTDTLTTANIVYSFK